MFHKNKNKYKIIIYKEDYHVIFDCDDFIYDEIKKDIWLYDKEGILIGCMTSIIGFIVKEVK